MGGSDKFSYFNEEEFKWSVKNDFQTREQKVLFEVANTTSKTILLVFDFDKTLSKIYMQDPLFEMNGIKAKEFWEDTKYIREERRKKGHLSDGELEYINLILEYANLGIIKDFSLKTLRDVGSKIVFFPGIPEFFQKLREDIEQDEIYKKYGIKIAYFVISNGFAEVIRGTSIYPFLGDSETNDEGVYANEFDEINGKLILRYIMTKNKKTEALAKIIKKPYGEDDKIILEQKKHIFPNMIYFGDGKSDTPAFTMVRDKLGIPLAVFNPNDEKSIYEARGLLKRNTVKYISVADFSPESGTYVLIKSIVKEIADRIIYYIEKKNKPAMQGLSH